MPIEQQIIELKEGLAKNNLVVFGAHCSVKYSGRAESFLEFGDRLCVIKPDKTFLVHQDAGNAPVNYMRENSMHNIIRDKEMIIISSAHAANKDFMEVAIKKMLFLSSHPLQDGQRIIIRGSEKDMSDMIYANPELIGLDFFPVSREEQTKHGFIDVLGFDNKGNLVVVECKRYRADLSAVQQLRRYVEKIKKSKGIDTVRGIVAAPNITSNAEQMLTDWGFEYRAVSPPKYHEEFDRKQRRLGDW
ncbi:endonuclease NucS [Candidatus Woesearchaeota archaeon]|nr:MAG: hypothetical protein QS99_C0010G0025 [archaeon GW2011_AR4]MBS3130256.1 endonuclease NucS [Candidatus Woesearchaeota archaeon]HIH38187.1 DUF91 domain-containing protein [Candidatus Woesearchaeota archaeon]HIH49482.1 DUF91 domain-containing protein [Candidatus Woesearchaeota archaeon]HIJ03864.1 DUF91 domain-containing protein [Candidatus Woesearchaeota archaeon]